MENTPIRIQRKRTKGFDLQMESISRNGRRCQYVGRPTKFGNPYRIVGNNVWADDASGRPFLHTKCENRECAIESAIKLYGDWVAEKLDAAPRYFSELFGKNLACFCREDDPCHADVLIQICWAL